MKTMKYYTIFVTLAATVLIGIASCEIEDATEPDDKPSVELTIYRLSSWTPENPVFATVPGATVYVYRDYPTSMEVFHSDQNGKVTIPNVATDEHCFVAEKGGEGNIVGNYLLAGVFQSQEDIESSPAQAGASVGGLKYEDINADGFISEDDQTPCASMRGANQTNNYKIDVIIGR